MVLIVALWILGILTLLAVGVGYQTSLQLRIVRYQRDRWKASLLAQTALNRAIAVLESDSNLEVDFLAEPWATGKESTDPDAKPLFEKIPLEEQGTWSVRYERPDPADPTGKPRPVYTLRDEEKKINLNTADLALLKRILNDVWLRLGTPPEATNADTLAQAILAWRVEDPTNPPREEWYVTGKPKQKKFDQLEELFLFTGMTPELFDKLEDWFTVYGDGKVNVNTASAEVLTVLGLDADLVDQLISLRQDRLPADQPLFDQSPTVASVQQLLGLQPSDLRVTQSFVDQLTVKSHRFRIQALGVVVGGKVQRKLEAVVEVEESGGARKLSKTLSFHDR